jgi:hypothetical protein
LNETLDEGQESLRRHRSSQRGLDGNQTKDFAADVPVLFLGVQARVIGNVMRHEGVTINEE